MPGKCNGPIAVPVGTEKRVFCYGDRCPSGIGVPLIRDKGKEMMSCDRESYEAMTK